MKAPQCTHQHALTIIELLVTITILAILAALIFPAVRGMIDGMNAVNCMANMRSVGSILELYRVEHDGYFPTGIEDKKLLDLATREAQDVQIGASVTRGLRKAGYIPDGNEALYCPAEHVSEKGMENLRKVKKTPRQRLKEVGGYALNVAVLQAKSASLPGQNWGAYTYPGDSKMLFLAENYSGIGGIYEGMIWADSHHNTTLDGADWGTAINNTGRHHGNNRLNFMFLDGHIAQLAPKILADGKKIWIARDNNDLNDPEIPFDSLGRNGKYINAKRLWK